MVCQNGYGVNVVPLLARENRIADCQAGFVSVEEKRTQPMNAKSSVRSCFHLVPVAILAQLLLDSVAPVFAAELKKPSPSPSDALFDPSRVIEIEIRLDPKDWLALRISHPISRGEGVVAQNAYEYYRADVVIDGREIKSVGVRKKGSVGSRTSVRPSLKINLNKYVKGQEFAGLEMITLNNLLRDPTKAQQFLVYEFMSKAGVPTPRSNLARVVVNGEDLGLYGHAESIDKRFIKRHFENTDGDLYESEYEDFTRNGFDHKWGKEVERTHLHKLVDLLRNPGPVSLQGIEELVDLDSFITFWAAEVLIGSPDCYSAGHNNFFVYRNPKSGKFHFLPWGQDGAFSDPGPNLPKSSPKSVKAEGILCRQLWKLPEIRVRYRKEMQRLLDSVWDEKDILAEVERLRRLGEPYRKPTSLKCGLGFDEIIQFVNQRRKEVQAELDGPAPDWPEIPPWKPPPQVNRPFMQVEGSFSATMMEAFPTNFLGPGSATLKFTVDEKTHNPFTRYGAVAALSQGVHELTEIRIAAADANGLLRWNLVFGIDPFRLALGELAVARANLVQGDPGSINAQYRSYQKGSTLELTQVSTNLGGTISGKFKINTTAFEEAK
jgi:hypothetical protein